MKAQDTVKRPTIPILRDGIVRSERVELHRNLFGGKGDPDRGRTPSHIAGSGRFNLAARVIITGVMILLFLAAGGDDRPTDTLQALVRQLISLQVEANEEETRWQEEKAHLETTLSLLEKERAKLAPEIASAKARTDAAMTEREQLAETIGNAEAVLENTDIALRANGERLLNSYNALPDSLKKPLVLAADRVRDALFGEARSRTLPYKLRLVSAFAADLNRFLSSVHTVKEVHEVGASDPVEVDVLYIGGAIGYYVSPLELHAGVIVRTSDGWKVVPRNHLATAVRRALAVYRKEEPAALIDLPVLPGENK